MPIVSCPLFSFFHFMPDTRFVLSASQPSPLWKKCVTRHSPYKCFLCQHGFISACSTVADKPPTHWSFSRDCAVSSFLKPPKVPQSRELKSRSGSCTYNLHHAVCFLRTIYQLMLKMAYCQPKWTHGVLSALVKCGHETKQALCADPSIQHLHQ